jgi:K+-sensing histidine kinase KdpD
LDSGVGIDPSREKVIFDLNKDHHSGIGLYLCSEFIKRLSGRIWSESSQGQGGVFHFIIPKTLRDPMKPQSSTQNPRDALDPNFGLRPSWLHQLNQTPSA